MEAPLREPGLGLAVALSRRLSAAVERVPAAGPETVGAIVVVVTFGTLLAIWRPIRRAVRLDPLEALRHD